MLTERKMSEMVAEQDQKVEAEIQVGSTEPRNLSKADQVPLIWSSASARDSIHMLPCLRHHTRLDNAVILLSASTNICQNDNDFPHTACRSGPKRINVRATLQKEESFDPRQLLFGA